MAIIETYQCEDCGFEFRDDDMNFHYNPKTQKTELFQILMLTAGLDAGSEIKGYIKETYCKHCQKFIRTYYVENVPNKDFDTIKAILLKGIEDQLDYIKEVIKKINKIKEEKNYQIKKEDDGYYIEAPEISMDTWISCDDYSSEDEAIEQCKIEFFDEIDCYFAEEIEEYQKSKYLINRIVQIKEEEDLNIQTKLNTIICPNCNNEIYEFINQYYPCPKCGGKIIGIDEICVD